MFVSGSPVNIKRLRAALEPLKRGRDIVSAPDWQRDDLQAERARRRVNLHPLRHAAGIVGIGHHGQSTQPWENLAQESDAFSAKIASLV